MTGKCKNVDAVNDALLCVQNKAPGGTRGEDKKNDACDRKWRLDEDRWEKKIQGTLHTKCNIQLMKVMKNKELKIRTKSKEKLG